MVQKPRTELVPKQNVQLGTPMRHPGIPFNKSWPVRLIQDTLESIGYYQDVSSKGAIRHTNYYADFCTDITDCHLLLWIRRRGSCRHYGPRRLVCHWKNHRRRL